MSGGMAGLGRALVRTAPGACYGDACDHVSHGRTFTDRDLYELLQERLSPMGIFWIKWDHLAPEYQRAIARAADEIWKRLT